MVLCFTSFNRDRHFDSVQLKQSSSWYVVTEVDWLAGGVIFGKYPKQYNLGS